MWVVGGRLPQGAQGCQAPRRAGPWLSRRDSSNCPSPEGAQPGERVRQARTVPWVCRRLSGLWPRSNAGSSGAQRNEGFIF